MIRKVYRLSRDLSGIIKKKYYKNSVYSYWWIGKINFGDLVTPSLLRAYGIKAIHKSIDSAEVLSTGSILQRVSGSNFNGIILGSGIIRDIENSFPNATILAVRGPLTAERIHAPSDVVLSDPGILISDIIAKRQVKEYKLGIVPHFQDKNHKNVIEFFNNKNRDDILFIDVENTPENVIRQIDKCEFIMSSSLHGLIAADSLGIPNTRFKTSQNASGGGDFKFNDYFYSINRDPICHLLHGQEGVSDIIEKSEIKLDEIENCKIGMRKSIDEMKRLVFGNA